MGRAQLNHAIQVSLTMSNTTPIDPGSTLLTLPAGLPALNCYSVTDINLPLAAALSPIDSMIPTVSCPGINGYGAADLYKARGRFHIVRMPQP